MTTPEYENELDLQKQVATLRKQLPKGMEDCTIVCKKCKKGHHWLTATNWIQYSCPTCREQKLKAELDSTRMDLQDEKIISDAANHCYQALLAALKKKLGLKDWPNFHNMYGPGLFVTGVIRYMNERLDRNEVA